MEIAAILISFVALAVSLGHLLWNVFAWRWTGPWVRVEISQSPFEHDLIRLDLLALIVRNAGRSEVSVIGVGLLSETDEWIDLPDEPDYSSQPELPYRLKPGEQIDWGLLFVDRLRIELHSKGYRGVVPVRGFANLGNGKQVRSKEPIQVIVPDVLGL